MSGPSHSLTAALWRHRLVSSRAARTTHCMALQFLQSARAHDIIPSSTSSFSTSAVNLARRKKGGGQKQDPRIRDIRYHLWHPLTPRPLRLSRLRTLRHWTIHRAWQLFRAKQHRANEVSLERQFNSMRDACEALRLIGEDGLAVTPDTGSPRTVRPPAARDPSAVTLVFGKGGARVQKTLGARWTEQARGVDGRAPVKGEEVVELNLAAAAARQTEVGRLYRIAMEKRGVFDGVPIEYARLQTDTPPKSGWDHDWKRSSLPQIK